ncbi:MAG TPA: hypothetical protein VGS20_17065 [Candidatus Acidoferrales bacterium]|nr:hypothetical protein [Candidatus Acidoferrales bacterium]
MNCHEFGEIVHELARSHRPGSPDSAAFAAARAHARICPECGDWLVEAEWAAKALEVTAAESRLLRPRPEIERELLAALRLERESGRFVPRRRLSWLPALGLGAAAAALSFLVVFSVHRLPRRVPANASRPSVGLRPAAPPSGTPARPVDLSPVASPLAPEFGSGFVPVPYAGGFMQGDSAVVLRVQLPRGDLAELGYPVDASAAGDLVRADLLVGEDGWPYAVRIVP